MDTFYCYKLNAKCMEIENLYYSKWDLWRYNRALGRQHAVHVCNTGCIVHQNGARQSELLQQYFM